MIITLWRHVEAIGRPYGVDPVVFGVLYLIHHPLFWGTVTVILARVRRRQPISGHAIAAAFFWCLPYGYVVLFGRDLPWWLYGLVAVVLLVGGMHAVKEIRKRLKALAQST